MPAPGGVELEVQWGHNVEVRLRLTPRNWSRLRRGLPFRIRGRGYRYDGDFFWDYWLFEGSPENRVRVEYGRGGDRGVGFDGTLHDVEIRFLS